MTKPRVAVAHYTYPNDIGGVTTWIVPLLEYLSNQPVELAVHLHDFESQSTGERIGSKLIELGIQVINAPRQRSLEQDARQTLRFLNQWKPTVFLPQCLPAHFAAAAIAGDQGLPWAMTVHSDDPEYWAALQAFQPHQHGGCPIGVSNSISERLLPFCPNGKVATIPCGVAIPEQTACFATSPFRIVYSGRLQEEQKRISLVLDTMINACSRDASIMATIIGDGCLQECRRQIRDAGMENRIIFTGRLRPDEVKSELLSHQAILLMSDYEGLPVALLEAMAAGVVPVVRDIPSGVPELVQHGETGLLVSEDCQQAADAIVSLYQRPDLWNQCSKNARHLILKAYERQNCFKAWDRMIDNLHSKANPHFPFRPDHKQLTNLPAILHSRYPGIRGPVKDFQESLKTMTAQTKAILRDRLWTPRQ